MPRVPRLSAACVRRLCLAVGYALALLLLQVLLAW